MSDQVGRRDQVAPLFSPNDRWRIALAGGALALLPLWWVAVAVTSRLPLTCRGFGLVLRALISVDPVAGLGVYRPGAAWLTLLVFAALVGGAVFGGLRLRRWWRARKRRGGAGMSGRSEVREYAGVAAARESARYTRRASVKAGLDVEHCPVNEIGWHIGDADGEPVVLDLQTQVAVFGPTGMGKTRYLMLNAAHDAPGALVITTTKLRDYTPIIPLRARHGRVLVWDPLEASGYPEQIYWDPTRGAASPVVATARGAAFAGAMTEESQSAAGKFFADACALVMTRLLMAGALGGRTMADVVTWGVHLPSAGTEARDILKAHAPVVWSETLNAAISGDPRTTGNVKMTLALKLEPLLDDTVMRHVVPTPGFIEFDPAAFVMSTDTLIIVTDDNARTNVAPLSTMLLNEIMDAAKGYAALHGVLDPPLTIVGDEIANVAPLPKLPPMLSDSRGAGIRWVIAVQSLAQLIARWGEHQAKQILANLNCSIVLGGLQDPAALMHFSGLAGKVDVNEASASLNADHVVSGRQYSTRERDVLRAEEIAQLPVGRAFVVLRNAKPLLVDLVAHDQR